MKQLTWIGLSFFLFVGCKKKPINWESAWTVPVVNDTLDLTDWVNDSTLAVNSGYYELQLERLLFDLDINDIVDIPDTTIDEVYTFALTSFIASPGFTFVSESEEHTMNIPDVQLKKVTLRKGYIDVRVENPVPTTAIFNVKLPGVKKDGVFFNQSYAAPPGTNSNPGVITKTIDLTDYTLDLTGASGTGNNTLEAIVKVSTISTGPSVTITSQDQTRIAATFRDVEINYAKGYFGHQVIEETDTFNLDLMSSYKDGILDLGNTDLKFRVENGIKVSAHAKLYQLNSTNANDVSVDLVHPLLNSTLIVNPASGYWNTLTPSVTMIEANSGNSNIESYIENMGYRHIVKYRMELNPLGNVSGSSDEFFPNSKFRIYMDANMPLSIGMDDLTLQDTFDLNLDQEGNKVEVISGNLILNATNAFPMSAMLDLLFLDANNTVLHEVNGSGYIQSGLFGTVVQPYNLSASKGEVTYTLNEDILNNLASIKKVVVRAKLNTIDPISGISEQKQIPENAYLSIKLKTDFKTSNKL